VGDPDISTSLEDYFVEHVSGPVKKVCGDLFQKLCAQKLGVEVVAEYRFFPPRRWRFDYALVEERIAIEVEGGIWLKGGGRHNRGKGMLNDMAKYNAAAVEGWIVIRTTPNTLIAQSTLDLIQRALETRRSA
jgi:very-short-patch-repair endonuclease